MSSASETATSNCQRDLVARVGTEIRDIGIPPRPKVLDRIHAEMARDEPDFRALADVISADVSLSASMIKVSNSPYFGLGRPVRTVADALMVLGLKMTVGTIAGIALKNVFPHVPDLEGFWDATARRARVCGWLVQQLGGQVRFRSDYAYTFGLFRDAGIPALMIPFAEYREIMARAEAEDTLAFTAVEDAALSINHAIVGAEFAEDWRLHEEFHLAIRHHHDAEILAAPASESLSGISRQLIAVSHLADRLVAATTGSARDQEWTKLGATCLDILQLTEAEVDGLSRNAHHIVANGV